MADGRILGLVVLIDFPLSIPRWYRRKERLWKGFLLASPACSGPIVEALRLWVLVLRVSPASVWSSSLVPESGVLGASQYRGGS